MIPIVSHDCELGVIKTEEVACVRDEVTCCLSLSTGGKKLSEGDMHEFRGELEVQHFNGEMLSARVVKGDTSVNTT